MKPILKVQNLSKDFIKSLDLVAKGLNRIGQNHKEEVVHAVDDVNFSIFKGEIVGVVGESGCGKSSLTRAILGLDPIEKGTITLNGKAVWGASSAIRQDLQVVFQDPYGSLDPRQTILRIVSEPLHSTLHSASGQSLSALDLKDRATSALSEVGLRASDLNKYPHEFSGGQRQRIGIARALALNPKFIVCDEPIAALDVSIQAQVVNLLEDLQEQFGLTYLFISHDLSMVRHIATRVAVMYLGKIVELAPREALYAAPLHPYTEALLSAVPEPDPSLEAKVERIILQGDVPSPANPPKGCNFCTRCPKVMDICREVEPATREVRPGHFAACHLHEITSQTAGATAAQREANERQHGE